MTSFRACWLLQGPVPDARSHQDAQAAATDLELAAVKIERLRRGRQRSRADGCVSSRNTEDVSWKVFPLVFLSPRVRTLLGCDIALLIGRLMLGVVLFAHGWQKLVINGIGGTYAWFQAMGIPLAIVATSFVTMVEFVGGALLLLGALTRVVVALHLLVMIGAAGFVHISHGLFAQDGGWELSV
jgi:uncharacterized membrane protein YphA (DoxX/SURF4 family)